MWCTTECWNCEDKTCEHYFSKQDIYFKCKKIENNRDKALEKISKLKSFLPNEIPSWLDELEEILVGDGE